MDNYIDNSIDSSNRMRERQLQTEAEESAQQQLQAAAPTEGQAAEATPSICPNCGAPLDIDTDYCESCHVYIKRDVCSFCGAHLTGMEGFCPECGNPLGGIVCPTCHTMNDFAFCKQCGSPLTEEAKALRTKMKETPEYQELMSLVKEMGRLNKIIPYTSELDIEKEKQNQELRKRVLMLLAQDRGVEAPVIEEKESNRMTSDKLSTEKNDVLQKLSEILSKLETKPTTKPATARNYAMATKPTEVRLGWVCNYKHALHSSPCGCAKPQMGGKWVVLGKNDTDHIKDDK